MKERLDVLLVKRGLAPSREKAKTMIMEGMYLSTITGRIRREALLQRMLRLRSTEIH